MTQRLHVPWFGILLALVTLAFETATHFDPGLYPELERHLALNWEALERFELHRLLLSPLLQTSPGFSTTIFGLTSIVVPAYELQDGTRRAIAIFFAGDWLSTLPVLFTLKLAAAAGSASAARLASEPDSGSSSGGFACLGALACSLPFAWRTSAFAGLGLFFAIRLALWHRLFDFQHALATLVGIAAWTVWEHRRIALRPSASLVSGPSEA